MHLIAHSHCDPGASRIAEVGGKVPATHAASLAAQCRTAAGRCPLERERAGARTSHNAHAFPPSRLSPGWLEDFEQYYRGDVGAILDAVTEQLGEDARRRFSWGETSFFMRWLETQTAERKAAVRRLVASGQLEFVGGGWVQHDEANPSPEAIVAQLTEGHEYLATLFGVKPRVGWSIDPFGASAASAAIAATAGYDALVINRVDFNVKDALKARAAMEFVWEPYGGGGGNASAGSAASAGGVAAASLLVHVLHSHSSAPKGFDFENPEGWAVTDGSLGARAAALASELTRRAGAYRTSHLLVPWGDDFKVRARICVCVVCVNRGDA